MEESLTLWKKKSRLSPHFSFRLYDLTPALELEKMEKESVLTQGSIREELSEDKKASDQTKPAEAIKSD
jgi:hypothetical protein